MKPGQLIERGSQLLRQLLCGLQPLQSVTRQSASDRSDTSDGSANAPRPGRTLRRAVGRSILSLCCGLLTAVTASAQTSPAPAEPARSTAPGSTVETLEQQVAAILVRRCLECHQPGSPSGGLSLHTADSLLAGGDSGPAIVPGRAADSLLLQRVTAGEMPPSRQGVSQQLPQQEIAALQQWLAQGAHWPDGRVLDLYERTSDVRGGRDWWSLQPLADVRPPQLVHPAGSTNPLDAFVLAELQPRGMTPAPPASRRELLRRVSFDLIGLPPTAAQLEAFEQDPAADAYARVVDDLLASPHFGERWARHWLDVARYAETSGYERDQTKPFAWKYRDWVVSAFNQDLPYDQFVREQLAGDELPERTEQSVIATGFLRLGTWNDEPNDPEDYTYERLEDLVHATSSAFLGLTVKCARCHDHKFDPIPQADYYRIASAFWPGPIHARDRELLGGPTADELGYRDVLGWTDIARTPAPLHVLKNGERAHPLQPAESGPLSCVPALNRVFRPAQDDSSRTTGLRRQLADWIVHPENPLTARVIVNRLWQHHFGEGLVRSSNNFGFTGDRPTHPALLDWLAAELIRQGWRLKPLHRLIVMSATYQQSSLHPHQSEYRQVDAQNRLLWRAHRRRLDAEALRDAFLTATGQLDRTLGGPSFKPTVSPEALAGLSRKAAAWEAAPADQQRRRSLYMFTQRSLLPPLQTTFDLCDTTMPCDQRDVTIVAPQALTLLNNEFVHRQSETLAAQLVETATDDNQRATRAWRAILNRDPSPQELQLARQHVAQQLQRFRADIEPTPTTSANTATRTAADEPAAATSLPPGCVLHLDASAGIQSDPQTGRVSHWADRSGRAHHATQSAAAAQPLWQADGLHGRPALYFDGQRRFLHVAGALLSADSATVFVVGSDAATAGHRAILSNWSGRDGNAGTSVFLGLTGDGVVRWTDSYASAGQIQPAGQPFLLTATNGAEGVAVFQQRRLLAEQSAPLSARRLDTPWVIGQQGNIDGEYWTGHIAEILVFDRQLTADERSAVWSQLLPEYALPEAALQPETRPAPELLAWASLCLVLFNSNEFVYVD